MRDEVWCQGWRSKNKVGKRPKFRSEGGGGNRSKRERKQYAHPGACRRRTGVVLIRFNTREGVVSRISGGR